LISSPATGPGQPTCAAWPCSLRPGGASLDHSPPPLSTDHPDWAILTPGVALTIVSPTLPSGGAADESREGDGTACVAVGQRSDCVRGRDAGHRGADAGLHRDYRLVHDKIYDGTPQYLFALDLTVWGWAQLLTGILSVAAGFAALRGLTWARIVGIGLSVLSMVIQFLFTPHYPIWSLLVIGVDGVIIWALATYRHDAL
jgi:hypothetical protein